MPATTALVLPFAVPVPPRRDAQSLHDALPISLWRAGVELAQERGFLVLQARPAEAERELSFAALNDCLAPVTEELGDPKSTRLNSSHVAISYAVFCLKKKNPALACSNVVAQLE